jgi:hypothetical protein
VDEVFHFNKHRPVREEIPCVIWHKGRITLWLKTAIGCSPEPDEFITLSNN